MIRLRDLCLVASSLPKAGLRAVFTARASWVKGLTALHARSVRSEKARAVAGARAELRRETLDCVALPFNRLSALPAGFRRLLSRCVRACCRITNLSARRFGGDGLHTGERRSLIRRLLFVRRPQAIVWRVRTVVVSPLDGVALWPRPHVRHEVRERLKPAIVDRDATSAVTRVGGMRGPQASVLHIRPDVVQRMFPSPTTQAVCRSSHLVIFA